MWCSATPSTAMAAAASQRRTRPEPGRRPGRRVGGAVLAGGGRHAHDPLAAVARRRPSRRRRGRSRRRGGPRPTGSCPRSAMASARGGACVDGRACVARRPLPPRSHGARRRCEPMGATVRAAAAHRRRHEHAPRPRTRPTAHRAADRRCSSASAPAPASSTATNAYFHEDLAELRDARLPRRRRARRTSAAGASTWPQLAASQRRLARYAPATALAMTMHSYWIGIAAELERAGDTSLRWILEAAARRRGVRRRPRRGRQRHPRPAVDVPAERVEGGYRLTGRKQFGSNGPVVDAGSAPTPSTPTRPAARRSCTPSSSAPARA